MTQWQVGDLVVVQESVYEPTLGSEVAVVYGCDDATFRVISWNHRRGKWAKPRAVAGLLLTAPYEDDHRAAAALANIARHQGLIPYGGASTQWMRVWTQRLPSGRYVKAR